MLLLFLFLYKFVQNTEENVLVILLHNNASKCCVNFVFMYVYERVLVPPWAHFRKWNSGTVLEQCLAKRSCCAVSYGCPETGSCISSMLFEMPNHLPVNSALCCLLLTQQKAGSHCWCWLSLVEGRSWRTSRCQFLQTSARQWLIHASLGPTSLSSPVLIMLQYFPSSPSSNSALNNIPWEV